MRRLAPILALVLVACPSRPQGDGDGGATTAPDPQSGREIGEAPTERAGDGSARRLAQAKVDTLLLGVSRDGSKALLRLGEAPRPTSGADLQMRWVKTSDGALLEQWTEPALSRAASATLADGGSDRAAPSPEALSTPALAAEVKRHGDALAELARSHDRAFAVSDDRAHLLVAIGPWLYLAHGKDGALAALVSPRPAEAPRFVAGGARFVVAQREAGRDGGVAELSLAIAATAAPSKLTALADARDVAPDSLRVAEGGAALYLQRGHARAEGGCLVRVTLAGNAKGKAIACAKADERLEQVVYAPALTQAVLRVRVGSFRDGKSRLEWVSLPDGKVTATITVPGAPSLGTLRDDGVLLARVRTAHGGALATFDPKARTESTTSDPAVLPYGFVGAELVAPTRYLTANDGELVTVDLSARSWSTTPLSP